MNISRSIKERYILDYYPLHDPFLLKGIKLSPYLNVIKSLVLEKKINNDPSNQNESDGGINSLFDQYASKYTKLDFTN